MREKNNVFRTRNSDLEKIYKIQQKDKTANYQYLTLQNLANLNFKQKDYKNAISNFIYEICGYPDELHLRRWLKEHFKLDLSW